MIVGEYTQGNAKGCTGVSYQISGRLAGGTIGLTHLNMSCGSRLQMANAWWCSVSRCTLFIDSRPVYVLTEGGAQR